MQRQSKKRNISRSTNNRASLHIGTSANILQQQQNKRLRTFAEMISRAYMKGAEFKARQGWLPFVDAVGMALQLLEPLKAKAWKWFKEWKKARWTSMAIKVKWPEQLNLWPAFTINQYRLDYV